MREEFADGRRLERMETADMRHGGTRDLGLTGYRLKMLKHSRCECGEPAAVMTGAVYACQTCADWTRAQQRFRRLTHGV